MEKGRERDSQSETVRKSERRGGGGQSKLVPNCELPKHNYLELVHGCVLALIREIVGPVPLRRISI